MGASWELAAFYTLAILGQASQHMTRPQHEGPLLHRRARSKKASSTGPFCTSSSQQPLLTTQSAPA